MKAVDGGQSLVCKAPMFQSVIRVDADQHSCSLDQALTRYQNDLALSWNYRPFYIGVLRKDAQAYARRRGYLLNEDVVLKIIERGVLRGGDFKVFNEVSFVWKS